MPRARDDNALAYAFSWAIDPMPACCSASIILRLGADYCTPAQKTRAEQHLIRNQIAMDRQTYQEMMRNNAFYSRLSCIHSQAFAMPVWVGFGAVLARMLDETPSWKNNRQLWIATDNITRRMEGDVHRGPFSTRSFCRWAQETGVMNVTEHRNGGTMAGWVMDFRGTRAAARRMVQRAASAYIRSRATITDQLPHDPDLGHNRRIRDAGPADEQRYYDDYDFYDEFYDDDPDLL